MTVMSADIQEVKIIEYDKRTDYRGFSYSTFNKEEMEKAGVCFEYMEEILYFSEKAGTLYGIHFQNAPKAQAKLLYCIEGRGIDYAVDLRKGSSTFLKWVSIELSSDNRKQIYIPKGFGHVFVSLEDKTRNVMRIDEPFDPLYSRQIAYNDSEIGIKYPIQIQILAPYDRDAPFLVQSDLNL